MLAHKVPEGAPISRFFTDGSRGEFVSESPISSEGDSVVRFAGQVRLLDSVTRTKIPGHPFEVLVSESPIWPEGQRGKTVLSSGDGEVLVEGEIAANALIPKAERLYLLVRSQEEPFRGATWAVEIELLPWERGAAFYHDRLRQGERGQDPYTLSLLLNDYHAVFLGRDFEVNSLLQLTTFRRYSLTLKPEVLRKGPAAALNPEPVREKLAFFLRVVLSDPEAPEKEAFISAFESVVTAKEKGIIREEVVFPVDFANQYRLDSRVRVHIELQPLSHQGNRPESGRLTANFVANTNGNDTTEGPKIESVRGAPLFTIPAHARKLEGASHVGYLVAPQLKGNARHLLKQEIEKQAQVEAFGEAYAGIGTLLSEGWDSGSSAVLRNACRDPRFALKPSLISKCEESPGEYFSLALWDSVDSVLPVLPKLVRVYNPYIQLAATFIHERQKAHRAINATKSAEHWVGGVSSKLGYGVFGSEAAVHTSFSHEREWYNIVEISDGDSARNRQSRQEQIMLSQEEIVLEIQALTRRCALLKPLAFTPVPLTQGKVPVRFECAAEATERPIEEGWFAVRDRWNAVHSVHSDPKSPAERGWTKLIRGQQAYERFNAMMGDKTAEYVFNDVTPLFGSPKDIGQAAFEQERAIHDMTLDGGIFPGVVSVAETSGSLWPDGMITRLARKCLEGANPSSRSSKNQEEIARYCRCKYEATGRRVRLEDYLEDQEKWSKDFEETAAERCTLFAKGAQP
ncbi:hypothetical protein K2X33_14005 [bacterium]|nr:hypothetical protein [bacterium]